MIEVRISITNIETVAACESKRSKSVLDKESQKQTGSNADLPRGEVDAVVFVAFVAGDRDDAKPGKSGARPAAHACSTYVCL